MLKLDELMPERTIPVIKYPLITKNNGTPSHIRVATAATDALRNASTCVEPATSAL